MNQRQPGQLVRLRKLNAALAANNARLTLLSDQMVRQIDRMTDAAARDDWQQVGDASAAILEASRAANETEVNEAARRVCQGVEQTAPPVSLRRSMVRLIGSCGRVRGNPPQRS